ncbi:unnamed protein product [Mytilus coruscus]|uniref:Ig-like domain-containing protein n=1 Tax=Mytilus coruscus TaxID=42192 RepID=A0A6J8ACL1_MYTCO|nr:unnamed protein product [Mytilus coruscus]
MAGIKSVLSINVILLILVHLSSSAYIPILSTKHPDMMVVNIKCPYECTCDFQISRAVCQNGFSLSILKDRRHMYQLKTLTIKRVEEVLMKITFDKFTMLENLDLSSNVISEVPKNAFKGNKKLKTLKLMNNYIDVLNFETFSSLSELVTLDLSHNNLHTFDSRLFDDLKNLEYLNLSMNAITDLPLGAFKELKNLRILDLTSNDLVHLTMPMLVGMETLHTLNISHNDLATIPDAVAQFSDNVFEFIISKNNFDCSCELQPLIKRIKANPSKYGNSDDLICNGKYHLLELENITMPCAPPEVYFITNSSSILARQSVLLQCKSYGVPQPVNYWKSPWGINFAQENVGNILQSYNISTVSSASYIGYSLGLESIVEMKDGDSLYIDVMRGYFAGKFTCVTLNGIGASNFSMEVGIHDAIADTKSISYYIGAGSAFVILITGIIIGCCNCAETVPMEKDIKYTIEDIDELEEGKLSTLDSCASNEFYFSPDQPDTPFNSPTEQTPRESPRKCPTPSVDSSDKSKSPNIKDTLDEVKVRLEKKMEKVRGHYNSLKETGSGYLSNIKGSAAIKVASGVESVKFGVRSIKEFCGTGDMGTQTISALSFGTDNHMSTQTEDVKIESTTL